MVISQNIVIVNFVFILVTFQAGILVFLTTEPNQMILVSFFSEDNVLSDEIIICYIFEFQSNENRAFHCFGDTRY